MKRLFVLAAAVLAFTACSKEDGAADNWHGEIRLASGLQVQQTRAASSGENIPANEKIAVYVDEADGTVLYNKQVFTANGSGGLSSTFDLYYPQTGQNVNIYAIHTNATLGEPYPTEKFTHTVNVSQPSPLAGDDLLFSVKSNQVRTWEKVNLHFYHLLSKVSVALKSGSGTPKLDGATVSILSVKNSAEVDLVAKPTEDDLKDQAKRAKRVSATGNAVNIGIATKAVDNFPENYGEKPDAYASAIVVPQEISQGNKFIKVELTAGGTLYYDIEEEDGLKLESGKHYVFNITVNLTGLQVTSTVEEWSAPEVHSGEAVMD